MTKNNAKYDINKLLTFLKEAPTAFQAADTLAAELSAAGGQELFEKEHWKIEKEKLYYVRRNGSALIAFYVPKDAKAYRVYAAHGDSPSYKVKENPQISVEGKYVKLNVETYGGMIDYTWLDRPLSVAGRVFTIENGLPVSHSFAAKRDLLLIPSVAIHLTRDSSDSRTFNPQVDMLPLFGNASKNDRFMEIIAEEAGVEKDAIIAHDLFLYNREEPRVWGADSEFFSGPHIDDLECALGGFLGFMAGNKKENISVFALFDNEEVGSASRQGAASTFLSDLLTRISEGLQETKEDYFCRIADSFLISADNGHALHPNHPEKADPTNRPTVNGGVLLKFSANQRYTTDGLTAALFKKICQDAGVPFQLFFNRSDMRGGSTLGNLSILQVPMATADIGLAQLAMHSSYETAGVKDFEYLCKFAETFFE